MRFNLFNQPSEEIQYLGTPYTQDCIEAIALVRLCCTNLSVKAFSAI